MAPQHVLILAPLALESRAVERALRRHPDVAVHISIQTIGVKGRKLAAVGVPPGATAIVLAGLGGGLDPALRVGDVVIDGLNSPPSPPFWFGAICHSDRVVGTVIDKQRLRQTSGAVAVDMESGPVRAWAADLRLPLVIVRSISDAAADPLPAEVLRLFRADGGLSYSALLPALWRPRLIRQLLNLRSASALACKNLGETVAVVVQMILRGELQRREPVQVDTNEAVSLSTPRQDR